MTAAQDILHHSLELGYFVTRTYIDDLTDAELLLRAVPGANHTAWQLGHMLVSTRGMLQAIGCDAPALPDGFEAAYTKETAASDDPAVFATKAQYLALMDQMKAAALAAVSAASDARLEAAGPERMRQYAPTVGAVMLMLGSHWLMHAGQIVPLRRRLGKPPIF